MEAARTEATPAVIAPARVTVLSVNASTFFPDSPGVVDADIRLANGVCGDVSLAPRVDGLTIGGLRQLETFGSNADEWAAYLIAIEVDGDTDLIGEIVGAVQAAADAAGLT